MSKLAAYLRGHLTGEVVTRDDIRDALSTDRSMMRIKPEMVIYPRSTNDIRKVMRFSWQLAEKGHVLPVTVRGGGTNTVGAAIGKGVSLVTTAHMNQVFEFDAKQKLVRLQSGVTAAAVQGALALQSTAIPTLSDAPTASTIGGAVANFASGRYAGKYGSIDKSVHQLEIVLASGDVIQTGRLSKRELSRRKGLQGFEGDVYRGIDGIIDEYSDVFDKLAENDFTGYNSIADVKRKDGSFDLTPLFVGSQGTLGVISELIVKSEFLSTRIGVAALVFDDSSVARDALDFIYELKPAFLEYFDAELFDQAAKQGRKYSFYDEAKAKGKPAAVVIAGFDDFSNRQRQRSLKKITKKYTDAKGVYLATADGDKTDEILSALDVTVHTTLPDQKDMNAPAVYDGFHIPTARLESFMGDLDKLATHHHTKLPLAGHAMTNTYGIYPVLELHKATGKQMLLKLLDDLAKLVYSHDGVMVADGGEGRLKTHAIYPRLDKRVVEMYAAIRKVFDPYGMLNPGVKQPSDTRELAAAIRDGSPSDPLARISLS